MRRLTAWASLASLLVVAVAAVAVRADEAKVDGDLKKFQGAWVRAGDDGPDSSWKFKGEALEASVNGMDYTCSVKLDEKAKPHATVDLTIKDGPDDSAGKTVKGIYKFDGGKLIICVAVPGVGERPTEFKTVEDEVYAFELKKE